MTVSSGDRFINPNPLSVIPSTLLTQDITDRTHGNPRHLPVLAEPAGANGCADTSGPIDRGDPDVWRRRYTLRQQTGKPLPNTKFFIRDPDIVRSMGIMNILHSLSGSRDIVWEEAENEKREELRARRAAGNDSSADNLLGSGHSQRPNMERVASGEASATQPFVHPWTSRSEFEAALDAWVADLTRRADIGGLLRRYLGWRDGGSELTVEGRKDAERKRKMSNAPRPSSNLVGGFDGTNQSPSRGTPRNARVGGRASEGIEELANEEEDGEFHRHHHPYRLSQQTDTLPTSRHGRGEPNARKPTETRGRSTTTMTARRHTNSSVGNPHSGAHPAGGAGGGGTAMSSPASVSDRSPSSRASSIFESPTERERERERESGESKKLGSAAMSTSSGMPGTPGTSSQSQSRSQSTSTSTTFASIPPSSAGPSSSLVGSLKPNLFSDPNTNTNTNANANSIANTSANTNANASSNMDEVILILGYKDVTGWTGRAPFR